MVFLLRRGARGFGDVAQFDARFKSRVWRMVLASLIMGAALWGAASALDTYLALAWWRALALAVLIGIGGATYFGWEATLGRC